MSKMIWQPWVDTTIAQAKQNFGLNSVWRMLRPFRMFMERFRYEVTEADGKKRDVSHEIEYTLFFNGKAILKPSGIYGLDVCTITSEEYVNGHLEYVSGTAFRDGTEYSHLKVDKDCVVIYSDSSRLPPVLYIWSLQCECLNIMDIIKQQNNMLRKPIVIKGEGADFDDAMATVANILTAVQTINFNKRKGKNAIDTKEPAEVLNLQVGNAYKGIELWANYKRYEELICDYLGYTTTKNEKQERMNTVEVINENSIATTSYKYQVKEREIALEKLRTLPNKTEVSFTKLLEIKKEESKDDSEEKVDRTATGK